ncbi:MAG TPA: phosphate ABC transporter ATP-binding protein [Thermoanaerobaculia bacterium]
MLAPLLRIADLTREVAGRRLVDGLSVAVEAGDVLAVVGPSGAGKSSFLRLLNRLDEPTGGTVYVAGADYREIAPRELRRRLGMVMQTPVLFPGTVADNLRFGPRQHGETLPDAEIAELLAQVGLAGSEDADVQRLSGGEAQRVSLARTLANSPEVLLLDEPTSALDEASKGGIEKLIQRLIADRSLTCLIVTHDEAQAARLANRVLAIESGRMAGWGSVAEVLRRG